VKLKPVSVVWVFVAWAFGMLYGSFIGSTAAVRRMDPDLASLRGQLDASHAAARALQSHLDAVTKDRDDIRQTLHRCIADTIETPTPRRRQPQLGRRLFDNSLIAKTPR
jgi:hypothetical protein